MLNHTNAELNNSTHRVYHSMYTAFKRIIHTLIAIVVVVLSIGLLLMYQEYQANWLSIQTAQPGTSISRQYAKIIQPALSANNHQQIETLISIAGEEPEVISIQVFDAQGQYLAPLPKADSIITLTRERSTPPNTHVESIYNDTGQVIGYINVHTDTNKVLSKPISLRHQLGYIIVSIMILALICGIYFTRGFYKFRPWIIRIVQAKFTNKLP